MKAGIAFSTKDRTELTAQSIAPLLRPDLFDLWWIDGSTTSEGRVLPAKYPSWIHVHSDVRGGADAAIVYNLTTLLQAEQNYEVVGLVENDCKLHPDWWGPTQALFERGRAEGLEVGAVSARAYEDRLLIQRDGYGVCHNLGAGMILLTRKAAEIVLQNFRTGFTTENRRLFCQLTGQDIGRWWAFRGNEHWTCADWQFDRVLASHGLASLALTPSCVEMIGQEPPLAEQGLRLVEQPVEWLRDDLVFNLFATKTAEIRDGTLQLGHNGARYRDDQGATLIFPHQIAGMGGHYEGDWHLKWNQGFGPFAWSASEPHVQLSVPVSGPCQFLVSGGKTGGQVEIVDEGSGYELSPMLSPEGPGGTVANLVVPCGVSYRNITLTAKSPGIIFYGLKTQEPQPTVAFRFDHSVLPPT